MLEISRFGDRTRAFLRIAASILLVIAPAPAAQAGGAGVDIPPYPLPVRQTELRIATQARLVCVADPSIECTGPYLDVPSTAANTDGGTFRSRACPGTPPGACRPDYVAGAEIAGELIIDWPIVTGPIGGPFPAPDPDPSRICASDEYKICHVNARIDLDITAPGVSVSNPVITIDASSPEFDGTSNDCRCIDPSRDVPAHFEGEKIGRIDNQDEDWWFTRNTGPSCDVALEYSQFLQRDLDLVREIGEQAFPGLLCGGGPAPCDGPALPVFVEPDGTLTKGCGVFTIRFARPNEPIAFAERPIAGDVVPTDVGEVTGDAALDLVSADISNILVNDGSNAFTPVPSGLADTADGAALADWDDDGELDLVANEQQVGINNDDMRAYPGDGAGGFSNAGSILISAGNVWGR